MSSFVCKCHDRNAGITPRLISFEFGIFVNRNRRAPIWRMPPVTTMLLLCVNPGRRRNELSGGRFVMRSRMRMISLPISSWKSVLSGVPQGSVLGPILFLVYINDLEEARVTGKILKFADDTKLFRKVKEIGDKQHLQHDIDKLVKWSEKWQMLFNFGKCKWARPREG